MFTVLEINIRVLLIYKCRRKMNIIIQNDINDLKRIKMACRTLVEIANQIKVIKTEY